MRGKVFWTIFNVYTSRITPAYAGKSMDYRSGSVSGAGSPPPMRGKATTAGHIQMGSGITPAYAGKSSA